MSVICHVMCHLKAIIIEESRGQISADRTQHGGELQLGHKVTSNIRVLQQVILHIMLQY